jgi:hypothetical protein
MLYLQCAGEAIFPVKSPTATKFLLSTFRGKTMEVDFHWQSNEYYEFTFDTIRINKERHHQMFARLRKSILANFRSTDS